MKKNRIIYIEIAFFKKKSQTSLFFFLSDICNALFAVRFSYNQQNDNDSSVYVYRSLKQKK